MVLAPTVAIPVSPARTTTPPSDLSNSTLSNSTLSISTRTVELTKRHLSRGRAKLGDMFGGHVEVEANGAWLTTSSGERFLNAGGYGVLILGSRHPGMTFSRGVVPRNGWLYRWRTPIPAHL